jgi:hypothetical protein
MVEDEQENSHKEKQELKLKDQKTFIKKSKKLRVCAITSNSPRPGLIAYSPTQISAAD